jgi:hypothetical protein
VRRVLEIVRALPAEQVFASQAEFDAAQDATARRRSRR